MALTSECPCGIDRADCEYHRDDPDAIVPGKIDWGWAFAKFERFCGLLQIQPKEGGGRIPLVLSPIQRMYCAARTPRDVILKPRQVHMTTCECARDLWWFLTKNGARVLIVVQSQEEGGAIKDIAYKFQLFFDSLERLGLQLKFGSRSAVEWSLPETDATMRVIGAGASEQAAAKKGRGGTVNRLHISEAAFFEHGDETFNSLTQSVPKDSSEIVIESTPNGAAGFYYEQWKAAVEGRSVYKTHFFPWWKHPEYSMALEPGEQLEPRNESEREMIAGGATAENLKWRRWKVAEKGGLEELVTQEFPNNPDTCFLVSGRAFFDAKVTAALRAAKQAPGIVQHIRQSGAYEETRHGVFVPAIRVWHPPVAGQRYVIGVDCSEGTGGDPSASIVYNRRSGQHCATLWGQFRPWELAKYTARLGQRYHWATIVVERNNHGHAVLRSLEAEPYDDDKKLRYPKALIWCDRDGRPGWLNNQVSRTATLDTFEQAHRGSHFTTNDEFLIEEMRTFIVNDAGKAEAAKGSHDDLVMASAIGWDVLTRPLPSYDLENLPPA